MPRTWQQSLKKLAIPARRAELHSSRSVSPDRLEKNPLCSLCLCGESFVFCFQVPGHGLGGFLAARHGFNHRARSVDEISCGEDSLYVRP